MGHDFRMPDIMVEKLASEMILEAEACWNRDTKVLGVFLGEGKNIFEGSASIHSASGVARSAYYVAGLHCSHCEYLVSQVA